MKHREYWLDYLRSFACVLVTVGHLLMSFQEAHILPSALVVPVFIDFIYCFHVYIFFFCSGYLFQGIKENENYSKRTYVYQMEKCVDFLLLYTFFSGITYAIKVVFSSDVNSAVEYSFLETLARHPINQMWYLYAMSTIYLFARQMDSNKSAYFVTAFALLIKMIASAPAFATVIPIPISYLCHNMIWFVIGQLFAYMQIELTKDISVLIAVLFIALYIIRSVCDVSSDVINAMLTLLGILASSGIIRYLTKNKEVTSGIWRYISKYMLQIYLLHTIFAAGIRIVLLKIGVTNVWPHLILGLFVSFAMPVLCAIIAERIRLLNIFFFPIRTIKSLCIEKESK